ncbi:MAG TPA: cellulase family glycosylhydrolase [Clostridia bacterium]|nr:cellulase family glycosylhydrolase [Clostridia bacterium]
MKNDFLQCRSKRMYLGDTPVLLRGFGLGGWLLPEGYMWQMEGEYDRPRRMERLIETLCGAEYAVSFWERYEGSYITRADIEWIASCGFNSVRLPINARRMFRFDGQNAAFVEKTVKHIDNLIDWCREFDLYVILDMHGAPGGQTGQNIDDSEHDQPELFTNPLYQDQLCAAWELLSTRYQDEPVVAAYDLLNEPLPNFFKQYNDGVLPLYRRLIAKIRAIDPNHMIMLEGAHWATDFTVLDAFTREEAADNIALQFHRYWSAPDAESLEGYAAVAKRLDIPLYLGESGENNLEWYTAMFPLCDRLDIGWSFWSYKKMNCHNSPVSFARPDGWNTLMEYIHGGSAPTKQRAQEIFDELLDCIRDPVYNRNVICALTRTPPFVLPCEAFDETRIVSARVPGAELRPREKASLIFRDGHLGVPDYQRLKGEPQPEEENIVVRLKSGDEISFFIHVPTAPVTGCLWAYGDGMVELFCNGMQMFDLMMDQGTYQFRMQEAGKVRLSIRCLRGEIDADRIEFYAE